ncbi:MAG: helix-turn-helix domain-containing protein [Puniceicoccales bacterium]
MLGGIKTLSLISVAHYHHGHGSHPTAAKIEPGRLCVELVTSGRGWVEIDAGWAELTAGALLWNGPGERTITRSDFDDPYRCLSAHFSFQGTFRRAAPRLTHWSNMDEVRALTDRVVALSYDESFHRPALAEYLFCVLQYQACMHAWSMQREEAPAPLRLAHKLIEENFADRLSVAEIAQQSGWSVPHLHAEFRREFGQSPHQALIERRIRAAKVRLAATDEPIKQVAAECGFASASAFCTAFRKLTSRTPAIFRQEHQHGHV